MLESDLLAAQNELVDWGILEPAPSLAPTRRFRGAMMRAAAALQAEEMAGARRPGHAMENTVALALEQYPLPAGAQVRREHRALIVAIELAAMPDTLRAMLDA